jgi:hypothetical protein
MLNLHRNDQLRFSSYKGELQLLYESGLSFSIKERLRECHGSATDTAASPSEQILVTNPMRNATVSCDKVPLLYWLERGENISY